LIYYLAAIRIVDSSSRNAVSFSSPRTTKRFRRRDVRQQSKLCARFWSRAETQPTFNPAFMILLAMISQYFTLGPTARRRNATQGYDCLLPRRNQRSCSLYKDETQEPGKMNFSSSISFTFRFGGPRMSQAA
jgi:hypothetical protein